MPFLTCGSAPPLLKGSSDSEDGTWPLLSLLSQNGAAEEPSRKAAKADSKKSGHKAVANKGGDLTRLLYPTASQFSLFVDAEYAVLTLRTQHTRKTFRHTIPHPLIRIATQQPSPHVMSEHGDE
jgi:hypothetical protein